MQLIAAPFSRVCGRNAIAYSGNGKAVTEGARSYLLCAECGATTGDVVSEIVTGDRTPMAPVVGPLPGDEALVRGKRGELENELPAGGYLLDARGREGAAGVLLSDAPGPGVGEQLAFEPSDGALELGQRHLSLDTSVETSDRISVQGSSRTGRDCWCYTEVGHTDVLSWGASPRAPTWC